MFFLNKENVYLLFNYNLSAILLSIILYPANFVGKRRIGPPTLFIAYSPCSQLEIPRFFTSLLPALDNQKDFVEYLYFSVGSNFR